MGSNGRVEVMEISPELAESWLGKNLENRRIRRSVVERYASDMIAGHWRDTDAMYTVREDGGLLDGQHRLRAIVLAGRTVRGIVHIVKDDVRPMDLRLDTGVGRTASDILGLSHRQAAVARFLCAMSSRSNVVTVDDVSAVSARIEPEMSRVTTNTRRGFTMAPVISAVCLSMWRYPSDSQEIAAQMYAVTMNEFGREVWSGFRSAAQQIMRTSNYGRVNGVDAFLRTAKSLEPEFRHVARIQFKDPEIYRGHIEPVVCQYIGRPSSIAPIERP